MSLFRRDVLLAGLALAASGCVPTSSSSSGSRGQSARTGPIWPADVERPTTQDTPLTTAQRQPVRTNPAPRATTQTAVPTGIIARSNWTRHGLAGRNINAMGTVSLLTIHHEGWTPVTFTDARSTYDRIEKIRQIHTRDRGWADIGYHYIVDRAGRILEGRSIRYQGAHVSEHNPHNIGVLVLGNFNEQQPSREQVVSLSQFVGKLRQTYRVPLRKVYTHQEITPTECPGRYLQARVNSLRNGGGLS